MNIQQNAAVPYRISNGYKALCPSQSIVNWSHEVRLKARERLHRLNIIEEDSCLFCRNQIESSKHLFFLCSFSHNCLSKVKEWLNWRAETTDLNRLLRWIKRAKSSSFRKVVITVAVAAVVYHIWQVRNGILWNSDAISVKQVVRKIKEDRKNRTLCFWPSKTKPIDREWFLNLKTRSCANQETISGFGLFLF
ncbi:uncharacterized protein LOC133034120 [Cannabis sativa]|uniref:uncharacterized protein LOC133034120 n=1 Tax=Cannabis sativa TaxID=3483 RepID=UPI0029C9E230|nr:uncharacterized protein LOC133034120 [Cannabis sativa]